MIGFNLAWNLVRGQGCIAVTVARAMLQELAHILLWSLCGPKRKCSAGQAVSASVCAFVDHVSGSIVRPELAFGRLDRVAQVHGRKLVLARPSVAMVTA